jgi:hypothetical protein
MSFNLYSKWDLIVPIWLQCKTVIFENIIYIYIYTNVLCLINIYLFHWFLFFFLFFFNKKIIFINKIRDPKVKIRVLKTLKKQYYN